MEKKILVVDDEAAVVEMLEIAFKGEGYEVRTAASAEEALELLRSESIQAMFLDLKLPGMNGVELCEKIREDNPIACIYAMTGYRSLFDLAGCREAGFDDYFPKPINLVTLFKAAERAFEKLERWAGR